MSFVLPPILHNKKRTFSRFSGGGCVFRLSLRGTLFLRKGAEKNDLQKDYKIHNQFFFTQKRMMEAFRAANIKISEAKTWYIAGA